MRDSTQLTNMCSAGLALLGHIDEKFVEVVDVFEPLESGQRDKCYISKGSVLNLICTSARTHVALCSCTLSKAVLWHFLEPGM